MQGRGGACEHNPSTPGCVAVSSDGRVVRTAAVEPVPHRQLQLTKSWGAERLSVTTPTTVPKANTPSAGPGRARMPRADTLPLTAVYCSPRVSMSALCVCGYVAAWPLGRLAAWSLSSGPDAPRRRPLTCLMSRHTSRRAVLVCPWTLPCHRTPRILPLCTVGGKEDRPLCRGWTVFGSISCRSSIPCDS